MNPVAAFVVVMLVWTVSDYVAKRTQSLLSSLFTASIIFLVGFLSGIFPEDLLASSSLLALAGVVVGFIIVHLGTMISLDDFKKQWRTLLVGIAAVVGIGVMLMVAGLIFGPRISGTPPTATRRSSTSSWRGPVRSAAEPSRSSSCRRPRWAWGSPASPCSRS